LIIKDMNNNPETLKYNINDIVLWFSDDEQTVLTGVIANVGFDKLHVIQDGNKLVHVQYDKVVQK